MLCGIWFTYMEYILFNVHRYRNALPGNIIYTVHSIFAIVIIIMYAPYQERYYIVIRDYMHTFTCCILTCTDILHAIIILQNLFYF